MPTASAQIFDGPGHPLRGENLPLPDSLAPGAVLVEIGLATICGSDLHTLSGLRSEPAPLILGHEGVGRVVTLAAPHLRAGRPHKLEHCRQLRYLSGLHPTSLARKMRRAL